MPHEARNTRKRETQANFKNHIFVRRAGAHFPVCHDVLSTEENCLQGVGHFGCWPIW